MLLEREPLLRRLATLQRKSRGGSGHLVLVGGEAGVGKTALLRELDLRSRGARVLWGWCDAVAPARPFGPIVDVASVVGGPLADALAAGDRDRVFEAFLAFLRQPTGPPTTVVLEDLHWADEATLDLLRVAGRRAAALPTVLIGTYRSDEAVGDHPLRLAIGDIGAAGVVEVSVPPLSIAAVERMARGTGFEAERLHRATGGNPFFVTEALAAATGEIPLTLRDTVIARFRRLSRAARDVVESASVVGDMGERSLVLAVARRSEASLAEAITRGMLLEVGARLSFRHDLARQVVLASLSASRTVALHRRALAILGEDPRDEDVPRIAHHAAGAEDAIATLQFGQRAGRTAAALGAHREAVGHFAAAARWRDQLDAGARAALLHDYARESRLVDDARTAVTLLDAALRCWREIGDAAGEGESLQELSASLYLVGQTDRALHVARDAVDVLRPLRPQDRRLARAVANLAQREMVAGYDDDAALETGRQALALAERLGDDFLASHALTTIGILEVLTAEPAGWSRLEESVSRARRAGHAELAVRAMINIIETATALHRYDLAERFAGEALNDQHAAGLVVYQRLFLGRLAELQMQRGQWAIAVEQARQLMNEPGATPLVMSRGLTLTGRVQARRGDGDPWAALDRALSLIEPGEAQELIPLHAARAEAAYLSGDHQRAGEEALSGLALARRASDRAEPWWWGELAHWAWTAGALDRLPAGTPEPYRLQAAGRHAAAAEAWRRIGNPYFEALALSDSPMEGDLRAALAILHRLHARPLARAVTARLKALGAGAIPRGPYSATRRNPAGLTPRQAEVLGLLAEGLSNAEIARRLTLSPRTVDHHVSETLRRLHVGSRAAAAREAERLGLKIGQSRPAS
jgi:DNA-binding CsgD family transcriptional regulator